MASQARQPRRFSPTWGGEFRGLSFRLEADYSNPQLSIPENMARRMRGRLAVLYGEQRADELYRELDRVLRVHQAHASPEFIAAERAFDPSERFTEQDVVLITYGDLIVSDNRSPLQTLADFAEVFFRGVITAVHVLPFYPYSSDRGFSVISFEEVDPQLGSWDDIAELEESFKLMFDCVLNHVSSKSYWFQQFLAGDPEYRDYFVGFSSSEEVDEDRKRLILRPRTTPLLHEFATVDGTRWVWTTFSSDQVDLNFRNPQVLLKIVEIMLFYIRHGADLLRLDAITYLWCELGTSCAHLEQTHEVVKLFRDVLDVVAPHVALVTETNAPHAENVTYFGDGTDEAQMAYNFALPPLVLHTIQNGDARALSRWADTLEAPSDTATFFNFLDSHDGIGVMGARGILTEQEIAGMCERVIEHGGFVSRKSNFDGSESPYELNITWFSALNRQDGDESLSLQVDRFIASRAVALVLRGVPGIYLPSLIGHRNDTEAVFREGSLRSINRSAIDERKLFKVLEKPEGVAARIAGRYVDLLERRIAEPAFHPTAPQRVLDLDRGVFAVLRTARDRSSQILCLVNVTASECLAKVAQTEVAWAGDGVVDLISGEEVVVEDPLVIDLDAYQVRWLKGAVPCAQSG